MVSGRVRGPLVEQSMAGLSDRKMEIVRTLVETAPDSVVSSLHAALAEATGDSPLGGVRRMVEAEARDRNLRNVVLLPMVAMCVGDGRDPHKLTFPSRALSLSWRALKQTAPAVVRNAELALYDYRPGASSTEHFDRLVRLLAKGIRTAEAKPFLDLIAVLEAARPTAQDDFLACLALSPVVRGVAHQLQEWVIQPNEDTVIAAKLAFKDAVAVSEDAGPRFFEMLAALLPHGWMILRIISAVMEKPTERYLAQSEMAIFGERVMQDIEEALAAIAKLDLDGGAAAAAEAAKHVDRITLEAADLEASITMSKESGWGTQLGRHKKALAFIVEQQLRQLEKYFDLALPTTPHSLKRVRRDVPKLNLAPDHQALRRACTVLAFMRDVRFSANYGGFAAARTKTLETLGEQLDLYVEELLEMFKAGEAANEAHAAGYLEVAAELSAQLRDERAAELIRRRGHAAMQPHDAAIAAEA